jgi:hypothetical protein
VDIYAESAYDFLCVVEAVNRSAAHPLAGAHLALQAAPSPTTPIVTARVVLTPAFTSELPQAHNGFFYARKRAELAAEPGSFRRVRFRGFVPLAVPNTTRRG